MQINYSQPIDMKKILFLLAVSLTNILLFSCKSDDMNFKDVQVSAPTSLYEPLDNRTVRLQPSASATLFFEWQPAFSEDGGAALYEVLFDRVGGDFSTPIYTVLSNANGFRNNATIPHVTLNRIAIAAGIEPATAGDVIWTVVASRGLNRQRSTQVRTLNLTALEGFAEIPDELFVTGAGSEGGVELGEALPFSQIAPGEFEIYTYLEAGEEFAFIDRRTENSRVFYTTDEIRLRESEAGTESSMVSNAAVYRINIDFNLATIRFTEIKSIGVFFSPDNQVILDLPYAGKGIWTGTGVINFKQESWGRDERYKFQKVIVENNADVITQLGTVNATDSQPTANSDPSYYYLKVLPNVTQWDDKWKFMSQVDGRSTTISVIMRGDQPYTHTVTVN